MKSLFSFVRAIAMHTLRGIAIPAKQPVIFFWVAFASKNMNKICSAYRFSMLTSATFLMLKSKEFVPAFSTAFTFPAIGFYKFFSDAAAHFSVSLIDFLFVFYLILPYFMFILFVIFFSGFFSAGSIFSIVRMNFPVRGARRRITTLAPRIETAGIIRSKSKFGNILDFFTFCTKFCFVHLSPV